MNGPWTPKALVNSMLNKIAEVNYTSQLRADLQALLQKVHTNLMNLAYGLVAGSDEFKLNDHALEDTLFCASRSAELVKNSAEQF